MSEKKRAIEVDLANERVVLATMVHDKEARRRLALDLAPDDFGDGRHRAIFGALSAMGKRGLGFSEDTLAELAKGSDFGGFAYVRQLEKEYEPNTNLSFHVDRLRLDSAKLEMLRSDVPDLVRSCEDPAAPPENLVRAARAILERAERVEKKARRFVTGGDELVDGYYETLRLRKILGGVVDGFGFDILDSCLIRGFSSPGLSLLAARPSTGKTTVLANLIRHRVKAAKPIFVGGWEMDRTDYLDMMVSAETGIPAPVLSNAVESLTEQQKEAVVTAAERYRDRDLLEIQENPFTKLERPADRWADLNLRNIDYLEGVISSASRTKTLFAFDVVGKLFHDRRPDKIAEALMRLGEIAKRYGVHVLMLHHMNRDAAQGRPTLEGLKGSGAFEEEADNVFALDRPILRATPARRRKMADTLDVHVLKQRKGPAPLCVRYRFDGARFSLADEVEVDLAMLEQEEDGGEG